MKTSHIRFALLCAAGFIVLALSPLGCTNDQKNGAGSSVAQQTFNSPDEAVKQIIAAVRSQDRPTVQKILGPDGQDVLSSGDEVADRANRDKFLQAFDQKHSLAANADGSYTLVVGDDDWPMPIPLVRDDNGKWRFDTTAGKDEILTRRIGQNELDVIQVCHAIVDAQREYAERDPEGLGLPVYADRIISDQGRRNGLYWETKDDEDPSPLGPLVAAAVKEGYGKRKSAAEQPKPYHGYFYRLLTEQGPHAAGGERNYVVNGKLLSGFAVVAYPAEYGNSGIMTFIVNQDDRVYQRDFGDDTEAVASKMKAFDPESQWQLVDRQPTSDQSPMPSTATSP
jgi:hypothetical protein